MAWKNIESLAVARRFSSMCLMAAVWLAIVGSVLAFSFGRDFERPKALCLSLAAAMLLPRALSIWPTLPRKLQAAVLIWLLALLASVFFALDPARGKGFVVRAIEIALRNSPRAIRVGTVSHHRRYQDSQ